MAKGDSGGPLADDIPGTIAQECQWPDLQPSVRAIAKADHKICAGCVGVYRFSPTPLLTATLEDSQILAQITGQQKHALYPMSEREFLREMDDCIAFSVGGNGQATALTQHHFEVQDVSPGVPECAR